MTPKDVSQGNHWLRDLGMLWRLIYRRLLTWSYATKQAESQDEKHRHINCKEFISNQVINTKTLKYSCIKIWNDCYDPETEYFITEKE